MRCFSCEPERLVRVHGDSVETVALAGTAPRGASTTADRALGEALCDSRKNGHEHAIVVQHLQSVLGACCDDLVVAAEPKLLKTRTVQHLCTELRARLRKDAPVSLLELAARLHRRRPSVARRGMPPCGGWPSTNRSSAAGSPVRSGSCSRMVTVNLM